MQLGTKAPDLHGEQRPESTIVAVTVSLGVMNRYPAGRPTPHTNRLRRSEQLAFSVHEVVCTTNVCFEIAHIDQILPMLDPLSIYPVYPILSYPVTLLHGSGSDFQHWIYRIRLFLDAKNVVEVLTMEAPVVDPRCC